MNVKLESKIKSGESITYDDIRGTDLYVVEFVCNANQRSSFLEAIANEFTLENNIGGIVAISSGMKRDTVLGSDFPYTEDRQEDIELAVKIIGKAVTRGTLEGFNSDQIVDLHRVVAAENITHESPLYQLVHQYYLHCRNNVVNQEARFLTMAAKGAGLKIPIKNKSQQTMYSPDIELFYGISDVQERYGRRLYEDKKDIKFYNFGIQESPHPYDKFLEMAVNMRELVRQLIIDILSNKTK